MRSPLPLVLVCLVGSSCGQLDTAGTGTVREEAAAPSVVIAQTKAGEQGMDETRRPDEQQNETQDSAIHVYPGDSIQAALDRAAVQGIDRVVVHEGTYRPASPQQAFLWFNARHDGLTLQAEGEVILTAANPDVADRDSAHYPAIVNHVVYFGDGISPRTVLRGFRITGANNFVTLNEEPEIEPAGSDPRLRKTIFFYTDGGGIKIFGRSYPTLENLEIYDNYSSPCGAGVSIEHCGFLGHHVTIRNCIFRNNRAPLTGAAVDLLDQQRGSSAVIENCLFMNNLSNESTDMRSRKLGTWKPRVGHGALTVFPPSKAVVRRCTFVGNRNGADDLGAESVYEDCIFWNNDAAGGWAAGDRYELDIKNAAGVKGCFFGGKVVTATTAIDPETNELEAPDPAFDSSFVPQNPAYRHVGYRPTVVAGEDGGHEEAPRAGSQSAAPSGEEPLQVLLRGRDFRWHISYPGADGQLMTPDDLTTQTHLHLPAETRVEIRTESDDYLYTVFLPEFDLREIAVPDLTHYLHFETNEAGVSQLLGDQLCGYTHPDLIGKVVVQPRSEFLRWCSRLSPDGS